MQLTIFSGLHWGWFLLILLISQPLSAPAEQKCVPGRLIPGSFIIRHNDIRGLSKSQKTSALSARANILSRAGAISEGVTKSLDSVEFVKVDPKSYHGEVPTSLKALELDGSLEEVIPDREICALIEPGVTISGNIRLDNANIPKNPLTLVVGQRGKATSLHPSVPERVFVSNDYHFEPISFLAWDANLDGLADLFVQNDDPFATFGNVLGEAVGELATYESPQSPYSNNYWDVDRVDRVQPKPAIFLPAIQKEMLVFERGIFSSKLYGVGFSNSRLIFQGSESFGGQYGTQHGMGDLDDDARPDLIKTESAYTEDYVFIDGEWYTVIHTEVSLLKINDDGTIIEQDLFEFQSPGDSAYLDRWIYVEDLNGDSRKDIIILSQSEGTAPSDFITIGLQNPNGSFQSSSTYLSLNGADYSLSDISKIVDLNGDNRPEIINLKDKIYVFQNDGSGNFSGTPLAFSSLDSKRIAKVVDYDLDGRLDILLSKDNAVSLLLNASSGTTISLSQAPLAAFSEEVTAVDAYDPLAIVNAVITITGPGGTLSTETDGLGNYEFKSIPPGIYSATIEHSNFRFLPKGPFDQLESLNLTSPRSNLDFRARQILPGPPVGYIVPPQAPADQGFPHLWGLSNVGQADGIPGIDVDALRAWEITKGRYDQIVAVMDTGIDYSHPEQFLSMQRNPGEIPNNNIDDDGNGVIDDSVGYNAVEQNGNPMDYNGHGTHVAGIIGAPSGLGVGVVGVSPNSALMPVRILDQNGSGSIAAEIRGMDYIIRMKDRGANIIAVNASFGSASACNQVEIDFLQAMNQRGIVFVAAAGNGGEDGIGDNNDAISFSPSNCPVPNVISVANLDRTGNLHYSSNFGPNSVHLGAPGTDIWSTVPNSQYREFTGTSMAAPHVAGVVALIKAREPNLTPAQVKSRLMSTVKPLAQLNGKLASPGIVDAHAALLQGPPVTPTPGTPDNPSLSIPPKPRLKLNRNGKGINVSMAASSGALYRITYSVTPPKIGNKKPKRKTKAVTTHKSNWLLKGIKPGSKVEVSYKWQIGNPGTLVSPASAKAVIRIKSRPS